MGRHETEKRGVRKHGPTVTGYRGWIVSPWVSGRSETKTVNVSDCQFLEPCSYGYHRMTSPIWEQEQVYL